MALNKTLINDRGITTTYHKIGDVIVSKNTMQRPIFDDAQPVEDNQIYYEVVISVESFVSAEIRQKSDRLVAEHRSFALACTLDELATTPLMALCYGKLKETDVFAGAEDC